MGNSSNRELLLQIDEEINPTLIKLLAMFPEKDVADLREAARQCASLTHAIRFLNQECELCMNFVPQTKTTAMFTCEHSCCDNCAANYFKLQIKEKCITEAKCPFCDEPKDEELLQSYYMWLEETLKTFVNKSLIEEDVLTLFQRKTTRYHLEKDPLFRWCSQCDNGMLMTDLNQKKVFCRNCCKETCCECNQTWQPEHEKRSCKAFAEWKKENDADFQAFHVENQLENEGIQCPQCKQRYLIARGGCLHFKCPSCTYEFCSGCGSKFSRGSECDMGRGLCEPLGMHAHHPRHCFYYLRDEEVQHLEGILNKKGVSYKHLHSDNGSPLCPVVVQKDVDGGLKDEKCGSEKYETAIFCQYHYSERLSILINDENVKKKKQPDIQEKDVLIFFAFVFGAIALLILFDGFFFCFKEGV